MTLMLLLLLLWFARLLLQPLTHTLQVLALLTLALLTRLRSSRSRSSRSRSSRSRTSRSCSSRSRSSVARAPLAPLPPPPFSSPPPFVKSHPNSAVSVPVLQAIIAEGHEICAVFTQPDRPKGRGQKLALSPVKEAALANNLLVLQPRTLKDKLIQQELANFKADLMVVVAYGLLLPEAVLTLPKYGCINVHASLLPKYRGASPIQAALLDSEQSSGVTIMKMDKGLDTGDMLLTRRCDIARNETAQSLHDKLAPLGARALIEAMSLIATGKAVYQVQAHELATYAHKITKAQAEINWQYSAKQIEAMVRAYTPWPIAYSHLNDRLLRIWGARVVADEEQRFADRMPGEIVAVTKKDIWVACGKGLIAIEKLQLPGAKPLEVETCLNAKRSLFIEGTCFN